jgi:hypothetical protein
MHFPFMLSHRRFQALPWLGFAVLLASCNYPGPGARSQAGPPKDPTSPPLAVLPTAESSTCLESLTVVAESGYLDATPVEAGQTVGRVWRVRNTGECAWTAGYELVPVEGVSFGVEPIPLGASVAPGQETDLRLAVFAPATPGLYAGGWALRSPAGALLGAASRPLRLRLNVSAPLADPTRTVYNLVEHVCEARWVASSPTRAGRLLPCPGYDRDAGGYVARIDIPRFSTGAAEDEPGLAIHPPHESGGLISGTYPLVSIGAGDQFRALLGCSAGPSGCQARYQLNVRQGESLLPIAEWVIGEADGVRNIAIDLTFLAGESVSFVLAVDADGPGTSDATLWIQPRIVH